MQIEKGKENFRKDLKGPCQKKIQKQGRTILTWKLPIASLSVK